MYEWLSELFDIVSRGERCVLVTVVEARGSTPREAGAKMVVGATSLTGTIGGGALELQAIEQARGILVDPSSRSNLLERVPLGPGIGQCCGGDVRLCYELIDDSDTEWIRQCASVQESNTGAVLVSLIDGNRCVKTVVTAPDSVLLPVDDVDVGHAVSQVLENGHQIQFVRMTRLDKPYALVEGLTDRRAELWVFGAGHVGLALVHVLADTPFRVRLIDSRPEELVSAVSIASNIKTKVSINPIDEVSVASPGTFFLVMTHSHPLDLALCEALLRRDDFGFVGLIGSQTKRSRFYRQLHDAGFNEKAVERVTCPIGIDRVRGKTPREIAISVSADLLARLSPE